MSHMGLNEWYQYPGVIPMEKSSNFVKTSTVVGICWAVSGFQLLLLSSEPATVVETYYLTSALGVETLRASSASPACRLDLEVTCSSCCWGVWLNCICRVSKTETDTKLACACVSDQAACSWFRRQHSQYIIAICSRL